MQNHNHPALCTSAVGLPVGVAQLSVRLCWVGEMPEKGGKGCYFQISHLLKSLYLFPEKNGNDDHTVRHPIDTVKAIV